ncbi:hypothetical protein BT67DRAFT_445867 [Trichocladium antarcticum]|uniref:Uncharacterized protein n=1 Tax=Trichocladium antarcticum TaxID=1450529 RepID=A0AAN6UC00_9PEZI|nr:hypothetical protein BT67DRAFT_445867 [Trichocladium antarcticum]
MAISGEDQGHDHQSRSNTPTPPPTTSPLSINRLLALHPRERLLVHPLCWTDRQLDLLGCRIHSHYEEADSAGADENAGATSSKSDRLAAFLAERLNFQLHHEELADTIAQLLRPLGGCISIELNRRVNLYFNRRSRASIRFRHLSVSIRRPVPEIITLACLDYGGAMLERESYFKPPSNPRYTDWEGLRRSYTLAKLHTPADPQRDPLLVALAIALAQKDRRHAAQPLSPNSSFTVRILATGDGRPKPVNLYVAYVKASFLDRLDFPSQNPAVSSGLDIDHWHIPAEPFQTLPQRVCQTLKPDGYRKTHLKNLSESLGKAGKKRKRDVASDRRTSTLKRT